MNFHEDMREVAAEYSASAGRGCVKGAVGGAFTGKGFQALCIGCAVGAAGEIASELTFPRDPQVEASNHVSNDCLYSHLFSDFFDEIFRRKL